MSIRTDLERIAAAKSNLIATLKNNKINPPDGATITDLVSLVQSALGGMPETPDSIAGRPLYWFDASCVKDATTLINKGTSTDPVYAKGLEVDAAENAILLKGGTGAFYSDFTQSTGATIYAIYKATKIYRSNAYTAPAVCVATPQQKNTENEMRIYCSNASSGHWNYVSKVGRKDLNFNANCQGDGYVVTTSVSTSGNHSVYLGGVEAFYVNATGTDYIFGRITANCFYDVSVPINSIPDNTYLLKAVMVYNQYHDYATVVKVNDWFRGKYCGE